MLDWISESILAIVHAVPAVFVNDEHHFFLMRAMFALLIMVLLVYIVAMWPFGKRASKRGNRQGRG
jgi:peptidoglycan/LPS O-acetylase OafA/YrhL